MCRAVNLREYHDVHPFHLGPYFARDSSKLTAQIWVICERTGLARNGHGRDPHITSFALCLCNRANGDGGQPNPSRPATGCTRPFPAAYACRVHNRTRLSADRSALSADWPAMRSMPPSCTQTIYYTQQRAAVTSTDYIVYRLFLYHPQQDRGAACSGVCRTLLVSMMCTLTASASDVAGFRQRPPAVKRWTRLEVWHI